ncbi:MAG: protein arginine kinase [Clostridia bacterium]|nr:protein arginine kinase [Clostridia bacterium]
MRNFVGVPSKWMEGSGPYADIVLTSRIRLARNLRGIPFPSLMGKREAQEVVNRVSAACAAADVQGVAGRLEVIRLGELSPLERQILVEKHLISPEHAATDGQRAVVLNPEESVSIMINEEDHLRLQVLLPALQLHESWRLATTLDDVLEAHLDFAFDEERGYLTACPTNVGTGLRASVMLHLPGLVISKQARRVLTALSHVSLAVRGMYGEGTEAAGNLFQISNQVTLGRSEEEMLANLVAVTKQLIEQERAAREMLLREAGAQLEDRIGRSFGILSHARVISSQEALRLLSDVRLGLDLRLLKGVDPRVINELMVGIQPSYLQGLAGREMGPQERDRERAALIRRRLKV